MRLTTEVHTMSKDTGGPAFPASYDHDTFQPSSVDEARRLMSGMDLRDYFAAHAPSIPFAWFEPVMNSKEPEFAGVRNTSGEFVSTNRDEIDAWKLEHYKQQCIQWPYAWADLMLAARVKP